ncbi:class I SAM-dependent methyltransferase [Iodobacter sp. HSC-16F04]|uniref:Class I SAM-dependent methyltransferase n=1 Tax=Iodobacter violaceini TaxID=3044271 RepID=A0ABX0KYM6_9NEIS|nr:class I SAM-dependent methyltransferase [Iodobacter violacea]NHQ85338.1 class I SAM-dependent methyltransferase [Iodobacter violacea]
MTQALRFVLIQFCAMAVAALVAGLMAWPAIIWALLTAGLSFSAALRWHDGTWWRYIHLVFPFAVSLALLIPVDPRWYLVALLVSWMVFGGVLRNRVPLYLSNTQALEQLAKQVPAGARLLDLGAGTGTVLAWFVRHRPDVQADGIEFSWLPWLFGRLRLARSNAGWHHGDAFAADLTDYDVVYAYLSPEPMSLLWEKAQKEMRPGSLLISNSFDIPNAPPARICDIGDWKGSRLLVWTI